MKNILFRLNSKKKLRLNFTYFASKNSSNLIKKLDLNGCLNEITNMLIFRIKDHSHLLSKILFIKTLFLAGEFFLINILKFFQVK